MLSYETKFLPVLELVETDLQSKNRIKHWNYYESIRLV